MRVEFVASDGRRFDTEAECLRHEQESPLFRTYDEGGRPVEVGEGVYLVHIIEEGEGGEAFQQLCGARGEDAGGIDNYSEAGWYAWDECFFERIRESLVRAMMRACYNIDTID